VHFNRFFPGLVAVFASTLVLSLLFKEKFKAFLLVLIVALTLGAWLDNRMNPATRLHEMARSDAAEDRGPVIHLLMDGFIAPNGLPPDGESQALVEDIVSFFRAYDFQIHTRAYTHYSSTVDSMTRAFNFRNDDENFYQVMYMQNEKVSFRENAWFQALSDMGYDVVVYQSESMDFCGAELSRPVSCNVFPIPVLRTIHDDVANVSTRVNVLLRTLLSQSMMLSKALKDAGKLETWGVSNFDERMLERLTRDVSIQPGNLFFAHVLLPHSPNIFRKDCKIDYESEPWTRWPSTSGLIGNSIETQQKRYEMIRPQIRCALKQLADVFDALKAQKLFDEATIVVHGDHGTAAYNFSPTVQNMDRMNYRDMRESFSLLFAVKYPGENFRINEEVLSLNVLMAQTLRRITGKSPLELGIEVTSEDEPFIYLQGVNPMTKGYIDIFKRVEPAANVSD
jgi:hypothetical protein